MNTPENDRNKELIARHLTGQATAEDQVQLNQWLAEDPKNQELFASWKKLYELSKESRPNLPDVDTDAEWQQFLQRVEERKVVPLHPANRWSTLLRAAAGLALLFSITFLLNYFLFNEKETIYQTADATQTLWLPDSSLVTLNKNSRLAFKAYGKTKRQVTLTGEAFFEVTPNAAKPFVIATAETSITVLGTSFNVRAYESASTVEVVVASGVVQFATQQNEHAVQLMAGSKGVFSKANQRMEATVNTDLNYDAWKTRRIVFEGVQLRDAVEAINKAYGVQITIAPTVSKACEVTVTFDQQTLDAVLNVLQSTLSLQYERSGDRIQIVSAECN